MDLAALQAAAAETAPMSNGEVSVIPGRLLLADGDGLAYYCAGNEDCSPGQARINLIDKLRSAARACGAERVKILLTARGSHKGFRYAVARVRPYQGHRDGKSRPRNWEFLRELMDLGDFDGFEVEHTSIAEADDLFSRYAKHHPNCVIYTQDKDMRMVPGWHLDWLTHILFHLEDGTWATYHNEKLYGRAWFWSQMLHGDTADNIPGLPFYTDGSIVGSGPNKGKIKEIKVGEKSPAVVEMLPEIFSDMGGCLLLQKLYKTCYGDRWLVEMLEQGILLWMRSDAMSSALDVVAPGNPLHALTTHELWHAARAEIMARIAESLVAEAQDNGSDSDAGEPAGEAGEEVRGMSTTLHDIGSGAGSRAHDGIDQSDAAPVVQCAAGEDREQLQAVRREEPRRIPAWCARLSAAARNGSARTAAPDAQDA